MHPNIAMEEEDEYKYIYKCGLHVINDPINQRERESERSIWESRESLLIKGCVHKDWRERVLLEPEEEEEDYTEVIKSSIECYCNHRLCPSPVLEMSLWRMMWSGRSLLIKYTTNIIYPYTNNNNIDKVITILQKRRWPGGTHLSPHVLLYSWTMVLQDTSLNLPNDPQMLLTLNRKIIKDFNGRRK